jgi:hypothetical protein
MYKKFKETIYIKKRKGGVSIFLEFNLQKKKKKKKKKKGLYIDSSYLWTITNHFQVLVEFDLLRSHVKLY